MGDGLVSRVLFLIRIKAGKIVFFRLILSKKLGYSCQSNKQVTKKKSLLDKWTQTLPKDQSITDVI